MLTWLAACPLACASCGAVSSNGRCRCSSCARRCSIPARAASMAPSSSDATCRAVRKAHKRSMPNERAVSIHSKDRRAELRPAAIDARAFGPTKAGSVRCNRSSLVTFSVRCGSPARSAVRTASRLCGRTADVALSQRSLAELRCYEEYGAWLSSPSAPAASSTTAATADAVHEAEAQDVLLHLALLLLR